MLKCPVDEGDQWVGASMLGEELGETLEGDDLRKG
jgi:hypothetical protein